MYDDDEDEDEEEETGRSSVFFFSLVSLSQSVCRQRVSVEVQSTTRSQEECRS